MKLGVNVVNFGASTGPDSLRRWVERAEISGFDVAMLSDHVAVTPDVHAMYPTPFYEPFTALAWLAGTTSIRLGTTVAILPYRHPLLVARMTANFDQLSGGRLVFGVGAGWAAGEYRALGVPFELRGRLTDEYLAAIITAWTHEVASFAGEYVSFTDVHTAPLPAQAPHPPVWVGGQSWPAIRRAVRFGNAWHPLDVDLGWLEHEGLPLLRQEAVNEGRPVPALAPRVKIRLRDRSLPESERRSGEGDLHQIADDLQRLRSLDPAHVVLDTDDPLAADRGDFDRHWQVLDRVRELL
ncbi:TIGR03619 family F420-dependent LLM class oxidoreductase [Planosporangium flavigriseum]|uniref:F420-dependent oxidoreductase n=1 Tax=Planosporangium flavigriseum TaxID=373681 RepID=A0A8J3PQ19_9ACTN|nr:TIGR03619 family F420-dependent LLM class oxidoreductase [Planosporangium flavigriseum]NJC65838.1 TIGR03619 family F420-dependent LLM class oxidoreductase [Planosporangium flavigriseum]GIG76503.1 F420-dependent oxidoreductase [Planosporangium flavigriseum]